MKMIVKSLHSSNMPNEIEKTIRQHISPYLFVNKLEKLSSNQFEIQIGLSMAEFVVDEKTKTNYYWEGEFPDLFYIDVKRKGLKINIITPHRAQINRMFNNRFKHGVVIEERNLLPSVYKLVL